MKIGEKLEKLIIEKGRNPNELSSATGIPYGTIYSIIKRNNTKIDLDALQALCKELGVTINYFVGCDTDEAQQEALSYDEEQMLGKYHALDDMGKESVDGVLENEYRRISKVNPLELDDQSKRLLEIYRGVNDEDKDAFIQDVIGKMLIKKETYESDPRKRIIEDIAQKYLDGLDEVNAAQPQKDDKESG